MPKYLIILLTLTCLVVLLALTPVIIVALGALGLSAAVLLGLAVQHWVFAIVIVSGIYVVMSVSRTKKAMKQLP